MASVVYRQYTGERDLPHIISLVEHELSEPYVIYTYRYFLNQWYVFLSLTPSRSIIHSTSQATPLLLGEPCSGCSMSLSCLTFARIFS